MEVAVEGLLVVLTVIAVGVLSFLSFDVYTLSKEIKAMALVLADVVTQVAAEHTVIGSVTTLLTNLKTSLDAAIAALPNQAALQALSDSITQDSTDLANAVVANTPAAL